MKRSPSRAVLGNVAVMIVLALLAWLLLRLHLQEDWWRAAPLASHWRWAGGSIAAYAALCALLWWRGRTRDDAVADNGQAPLLLVWASQTGFAQQLCERSAEVLRASGMSVRVRGLHQVDAPLLQQSTRVLLIASTTGEGDAPDHALPFLRRVMPQALALPHLQYGVLALGDRSYGHFCAFGHQLDAWLRQHGAHPLFDTVEVDNADPAALRHWQQLLGQLGGNATDLPDWAPAQYQPWQLRARAQVNAGSPGAATWQVALVPADGVLPPWQAGDVVEIGPQHGAADVDAWLARHARDGAAMVEGRSLHDWLAHSHLPVLPDSVPADDAALVAALKPLPHREYSIASTPAEGQVLLLLRRLLRPDGTPGLGSGWLCDYAQLGGRIDLRFRSNPNFHAPSADVPLILIGNGTGIAGLRAHLRARVELGASRNWLLFGERTAAHDFHFGEDIQRWQRDGMIAKLDTVFSRDGGTHRYVQDRLLAELDTLRQWVRDGATILVCGSLQGMAPAVDAVIEQALGRDGKEALIVAGRYRRDVY
ncbi:sulfite reductase subunit alpha [Stenotrophomonas aracearum]|jgi:sulfite reductase (NADPH) flavoprotein alpha-component|uniref:NADPH--hemoprotein reductase n=1 Tax=Stenotrophomonas aracearum TaxID=3003272 RepID=A0ABY9YFR8_9GAMM|nr:sulfite reductase subunit alpha [Stenotrophomonas sp. A5588]WNH49722.1 sulfite reductase subunit alpha [Stenotrophomonas sp. A5588]